MDDDYVSVTTAKPEESASYTSFQIAIRISRHGCV